MTPDDYNHEDELDLHESYSAENDWDDDESSRCPHCDGTGIDVWTGLEECEYCDGMGYKWWE